MPPDSSLSKDLRIGSLAEARMHEERGLHTRPSADGGVRGGCGKRNPDAHIFFAPKSLRAGNYFLPELAKEITQSTAFVILVGEKGVGQWQVIEYYEAFDRRVKEPDYPVILILHAGQAAPGLPAV
jgi:hypothetical protein